MIVYPAIDIRRGRVVRLVHGDPARETVHGDDPIVVAARWLDAGAPWLHVINLDGARCGRGRRAGRRGSSAAACARWPTRRGRWGPVPRA